MVRLRLQLVVDRVRLMEMVKLVNSTGGAGDLELGIPRIGLGIIEKTDGILSFGSFAERPFLYWIP